MVDAVLEISHPGPIKFLDGSTKVIRWYQPLETRSTMVERP